jgi:hypothetical protein
MFTAGRRVTLHRSHSGDFSNFSRQRRALLVVAALLGSLLVGLTPTLTTHAHADGPTVPAAGEFVPLSSTRVISSTSNLGITGQLQPGQNLTYNFLGVGGVPTSGVQAVVLHVDTSGGSASGVAGGYLWVYPTNSTNTHPSSSTLVNSGSGLDSDNTAIVALGSDQSSDTGKVSFYDGSGATAVSLLVDLEGYVTDSTTSTAQASFSPLTLTRVIDSRNGTGGRSTPLTSSNSWNFSILGAGGVPTSNVTAVALNLGATNSASPAYVAATPAGQAITSSASKVQEYGSTEAQQLAIVAPGTNGQITFSTNSPSINFYVDVEGYYLSPSSGTTGAVFVPLDTPQRIVNTAAGIGISSTLQPASTNQVAAAGVDGIPTNGLTAIAATFTGLNSTSTGYVEAWPDGTTRPTPASTLNVASTIEESNLAFVNVGDDGDFDIYNSSGESTDLWIDVTGYFIDDYATEGASANYYDSSGNLIGGSSDSSDLNGSKVLEANSPDSGLGTDTPTDDGSSDPAAMTAAIANATATCHSGQRCGTPTKSGCTTWHVHRTEVHTGIVAFHFNLDIHFCWANGMITPGTLNVNPYISDARPWISDQGNSEASNYYYDYWPNEIDTGHASKYERHLQQTEGVLSTNEYPWIHEYVHSDGTMDFHTGD